MALFDKKKPSGTPTDVVIQMRQQGLANDQIIANLQREGYSSAQIYDAMNQADIKGVVESAPMETGESGESEGAQTDMPTLPEEMPAPEEGMPEEYGEMPPMPEEMLPHPGGMPAPSYAAPRTGREEIEEIVEPIIDEKWEELMKSVDKIVAWKESTETKIVKIQHSIKDLKDRFEELHSGILAKVGEYDKNIKDVGSDIKAMESVFKKVLPTFTENVSELSRVAKKLKSKKK